MSLIRMNFKKYIFTLLASILLCSSLDAARRRSKSPERKIVITKEMVAQYKETFPEYMRSKESELATLTSWTDENSLVGSWVSWGLDTFGSALGLGSDFNTGKAKKFLNRILDESKKEYSDTALDTIEMNGHNIAYLEKIFSNLEPGAIKRKERDKLTDQIKATRHSAMPEEINDIFATDDDVFFQIGTCKLFAFHILESKDPMREASSSDSESDETV